MAAGIKHRVESTGIDFAKHLGCGELALRFAVGLEAAGGVSLGVGRVALGVERRLAALRAGENDVVPFLLEDMLKAKGGDYSKGPDFQPYLVEDGLLITGQNPASSGPAAEALMKALAKEPALP